VADRGADPLRRAAAEAIGTYFLVLIGTGAVMVDARTGGALGAVGIALAFGFVVMGMVYAIGHISGAHINSAVTIGFWSIGRFPSREVPLYLAAQCTGAIAASATLRLTLGDAGRLGATIPAIDPAAALVIEGLLTFALMFVITAVATDERVADGFAGLAIGIVIAFDALMGGALTGASMNPARSLGPAVVGATWTGHWIYWLGPIAGAVLGARAYEAIRPAGAPVPAGPLGVQGPLGVEGPVPEDPGAD